MSNVVLAFAACSVVVGCTAPSSNDASVKPDAEGVFHVHPGESIQAALELASRHPEAKIVRVHAGVYRPDGPRQALIWLHRKHDGITLEAEGEVTLTAANEDLADKNADSFPAIVNHVVYLGDGLSSKTVLRGFKITGANHFVTKSELPEPIQPALSGSELKKAHFFYADGGGIKIFGRSYPTIENVEVFNNFSNPCGAGVSIEHRGYNKKFAVIRNCIFRDNRCQVTGSAVDVLPGSAVILENCLFYGNVSNVGPDKISPPGQPYSGKDGSGALTVFANSRVRVRRCTFTDNWNGVDDRGERNEYTKCVFWMNTRSGGTSSGRRYELDILDGRNVTDCFLNGDNIDPRGSINLRTGNRFAAPDPRFDEQFTPQTPSYAHVGYRATSRKPLRVSGAVTGERSE